MSSWSCTALGAAGSTKDPRLSGRLVAPRAQQTPTESAAGSAPTATGLCMHGGAAAVTPEEGGGGGAGRGRRAACLGPPPPPQGMPGYLAGMIRPGYLMPVPQPGACPAGPDTDRAGACLPEHSPARGMPGWSTQDGSILVKQGGRPVKMDRPLLA